MKNALLVALVLTSLSSLIACAKNENSTYQQDDPQAILNDPKTVACVNELRAEGIVGKDQQVYVYTDNTRIQDVRRVHPEAYVVTISELRSECHSVGYPIP